MPARVLLSRGNRGLYVCASKFEQARFAAEHRTRTILMHLHPPVLRKRRFERLLARAGLPLHAIERIKNVIDAAPAFEIAPERGGQRYGDGSVDHIARARFLALER